MTAGSNPLKKKYRSLPENSLKLEVRFHVGIFEIVTIIVIFGT